MPLPGGKMGSFCGRGEPAEVEMEPEEDELPLVAQELPLA